MLCNTAEEEKIAAKRHFFAKGAQNRRGSAYWQNRGAECTMQIPQQVWRSNDETVYGRRQSAPSAQKIIGQVQAIDRMVDEDVPCEDILAQINAAKSALHGCGKVVLEGHIKHCVRDGIEHGDADKTIENFTKAVERFSNMG